MDSLTMDFVINRKRYTVAPGDVESRMRGVQPEIGRLHFVEIEGREYPVKQVIRETLQLAKLDFTTLHARALLTRLGFRVYER